jgi:hypothetical protein
MASFKSFACLLAVFIATAQANHFRSHRLVRIAPKSEEQKTLVGAWRHNPDFDIWSTSPEYIDVHLSPKAFSLYSPVLDANNVEYKVINNDIQNAIDEETRSIQKLRLLGQESRVVNTYASHAEINVWMDAQAAANPTWVTTASAGKTIENRDLKVITLKKATTKRSVWIDCGTHAREWITHATCVYMIDAFIREANGAAKAVLDYYEIKVLPVHNPDGYEFSRSSSANRLWRKNRNRNSGSTCIGVDIGRNFGYQWMVAGASNNPCSDIFAGPTPDSELETKALEAQLNAKRGQWDAFFTIHAYGLFWFTPWGWTSALPADYNELAAKAQIGANAAKAVFGSTFRVGSSTNLLYISAGASDDWAKAVAGIKYSHFLEVRPGDTGVDASFGFTLPVDRVPKAGEETYRGILAELNALITGF